MQIPGAINDHIPKAVRDHLDQETLHQPVGGEAVMHSHNTLPGMAQKYHAPMWKVPLIESLEYADAATIRGNREIYFNTCGSYLNFAAALLERISLI
jgi:hypothetical protein